MIMASSYLPTPSYMALPFLIIALHAFPAAMAFMTPSQLHSPSLCCNNRLLATLPIQIPHPRRSIILVAPNDQVSPTTTTRLNLFGNLFGKEEVAEDQKDLQENELSRFSHLLSSDANPKVKFDSLSIMVSSWSKLFTDDNDKKKMGLTTPVTVVDLTAPENNDVSNYSGVQLLFKKGKTGGRSAYQDKDDEKLKENKKENKGNKDAIKEGGVEVRVEQLSNGDLQVIATRCEIDEGTVVKEMSEQTIIDSLRKAMAAWKKEQGS